MASLVMFVRVVLLVGVLAPFALTAFALIAAPAALVSGLCALWLMRRAHWGRDQALPNQVKVTNPFDLKPALLLTAMVMVLTVAANWVLARYGHQGLATVLAISGTADVDSAIITMGGLPKGTLSAQSAALILAIPVMLNTLFKGFVAVSIAGWSKGRQAALPLVAVAITVAATALATGWDWPA